MLYFVLIAIGAIVLDQATKYLAVHFLKDIFTLPIIEDVLHLTYIENTGAAFGMLKNNRWIFLIISIDFRIINFAVFNVADSFVCVGAVLVLIYVFFFSEKDEKAIGEAADGRNTDGN